MTTNAIDINAQQQTDSYRKVFWYDGRVDTYNYKSMTRYLRQLRPKSVTIRPSRSGWRNPSGWSHYRMSATPAPFIDHVMTENFGIDVRGDGYGWNWRIPSMPSFPNDLESRAVVKALLALKGQNVNYAQAFAEREQVSRMFAEMASTIGKGVRAFRKTKPKDWVRVLKASARKGKYPESWLSLQYGWKPFMSDVYGAVADLNERERDGDAYRATVKGTVKSRAHGPIRIGTQYTGLAGLIAETETEHICKVRLDYVLENPLLASLSQLGVTNPAALVWELVPYSFVVDWALPIGNYLSAWDAALGWSLKGGTLTKFSRYNERGVGFFVNDKISSFRGSPSAHQVRAINLVRTVYSSSPLPRIPSLKNPISSGHVANAMSLLVAAFR